MMKLLLCLIVFRLLWAILPQSGYIHPDEFFQTVEVVAEDALNISAERTWEFNDTFPLRSVAIPQLVFYPVFKLLAYMDETTTFQLSAYHIISSYRLVMALMSISIDISILRVCQILHLPCGTAVTLLASSYVMLTFQTHPFTNSFETLLLSLLIMMIVQCKDSDNSNKRSVVESRPNSSSNDEIIDTSNEMCDLDSSFNKFHKMAFVLRKRNTEGTDSDNSGGTEHVISNKTEKVQDVKNFDKHMNRNNIDRNSKNDLDRVSNSDKFSSGLFSCVIAITVVVGIFNRPTFVLFSFLPCLWWLHGFYRNISLLVNRTLIFLLASTATAFVFISIDSIYYNDISVISIFQTESLISLLRQCVVTPINFILYNSVSSNLATHGHHPFYVHFTVNMPMLYAPLLFCLAKSITSKFIFPSNQHNSKDSNTSSDLNTSTHQNIGIVFLSFTYFPVLCLSLFPHQEARFLIPLLPLVVLSVVSMCGQFSKLSWVIFITFNLALSIVFGVLHQGGVVPCLLHLQKIHHSFIGINQNRTMHVLFSHTYMPPKHLLLSQPSQLKLYDMQGKDLHLVYKKLADIKSTQHLATPSDHAIFLALPGTLVADLKIHSRSDISYSNKKNFFPHLSFEDPPDLQTVGSLNSLYNMFSLVLMEIS